LFGSAGRWCRFSAFDQRSTIRLIADRGGRWPDHAILRVDNLFDRGPPRSNTSGSIPSFSDNSRIFLVSPSVLRSVNGLVYVDVLLHGESRSIQNSRSGLGFSSCIAGPKSDLVSSAISVEPSWQVGMLPQSASHKP